MSIDNMITGVESSTQADERYKETKTLLHSVSMNFASGLQTPPHESLQNIIECDRTSVEARKVLRTSWNLTTDTIFINGSHKLTLLRSDHKRRTTAVCQ